MKVLSIETSSSSVSAALIVDAEVVGFSVINLSQLHVETIIPLIDSILKLTKVTKDDLDAVCVDIGPGLFTGLRVGIVTANTIAKTLSIPIAGITSTEVLASSVSDPTDRLVMSILDARRQEIFYGIYRLGKDGLLENITVNVVNPLNLLSELDHLEKYVMVGNLTDEVIQILGSNIDYEICTSCSKFPLADRLGLLAVTKNEFKVGEVRPLYLREPDATKSKMKIDGNG